MTDRKKISLRKHPDYPEIWFEARTDPKSGYEYFEALDPEVAVDAGLLKTYYAGWLMHHKFVKGFVPVYKVVLAE